MEIGNYEGIDARVEERILDSLKGCRFDKMAITWSKTLRAIGVKKNSPEEVVATDWLTDSRFIACSKCDVVCDSIDEVRWSGYDFVLKNNGKVDKKYVCLCDQCVKAIESLESMKLTLLD